MKLLFLQEYLKTGHVSFAVEFAIRNCSVRLQRGALADEST